MHLPVVASATPSESTEPTLPGLRSRLPTSLDESGHFKDGPCVPRFKFALRGAFARQINRKLIKRLGEAALRGLPNKYWGATPLWFCVQTAIYGSEKGNFSEQSPDTVTESTRMSGEPDTVTSSKQ